MPISLTMPRLSDTMEAGTVIRWNVKEGDKVRSGDVVADIETDKATMEMQCFDDGTVSKLLVEPGKQVPVGTPIAMIEVKGPDGKSCASLAVFPTATIARAESLRMRVPIEGGFWVTLSAPIGGVVEWLRSLQVQAVSVVNATPSNGPSCVLGLDFIEWVKKVEAQQQQAPQQQ